MSKLKPTWYQLVNLDGEIGLIAYNASAKLYRKWLPNKAISLSKYLTELGENNIHVATVTPEDYNKLPTEVEYYTEADLRAWVNAKIANKGDDKKETPITGVLKYARDKDLQVSANFNTSELQCKCGVRRSVT